MSRSLKLSAVVTLVLVCGRGGGEPHEKKGEAMDLSIYTPKEVKWADAPPVLPPGAKAAGMEGNAKEPGPFTMRLKFPANYKVSPHTHPADEHITVISGTFYMGMGDKFDEAAAKELPTGSFVVMPTKQAHFAMTKGETVVQLHGMGPWGINYVNPADDPRSKAAGTAAKK